MVFVPFREGNLSNMMKRISRLCIPLLLLGHISYSQIVFSGKVWDRSDSSAITAATITNLFTRKSTAANDLGEFNIHADFGDSLRISAVGYMPATIAAMPQYFLRSPLIFLIKEFNPLSTVTVYSDNYKSDSLSTRIWYDSVRRFNNPHLVSINPQSPGLTFSPVTYFSAKAKAKRKLVKWLDYTEKEDYVSYRFSSRLIARYTGLTGDSLRTFLLRYRPTYEYCKAASEEDMLLYINDSFKDYRAPDPKNKPKRRKR